MAWKLEAAPHRVYPRNPLAAVIVDLRFHPILKIASKVPDFQEAVRSVFTEYQEQAQQLVAVQPFGAMQVTQGTGYVFRKSNASATLTLTTTSLTLDSRRHADRDQLISEACLAFDALHTLYAPVVSVRLGMRYVNIIDREPIGQALGRVLDWNELLTKGFCDIPTGLADEVGTHYSVDVSSPMQMGALTTRYGLLRDPRDGRDKFRFDTDRYLEESIDATALRRTLETFSDEIFAVFSAARGPALEEWMALEVVK